MKHLLLIAMIGLGVQPAAGQAPPVPAPAKAMSACEALTADWRRVEQNMADRFVEALGDNSAPRATMREMREANDLTLATMTLQFMRDNKCALPKRAPNMGTYLGAALDCSKARQGAGSETPAACVRENWTAK